MRTISADTLKEMFAANTGLVFLHLLTISHPNWLETYRFVNDTQDLVYNSNTYTALPFEATLPADEDDLPPTVTVRLDNIDKYLVEILRTLTDPPDVSLEIVSRYYSASYFRADVWHDNTHDWQNQNVLGEESIVVTSEIGPIAFKMLSYSNMAYSTIEIELGYESDILNEAATKDIFSPNSAPGLF